jgi:phosphoribosylformylglycinamidine synthase
LAAIHGQETGYPIAPDLAGESRLIEFLVGAADASELLSAHDLAEGGFAVGLAEVAIGSNLGGEFVVSDISAEALFGEAPGRVLVATHHFPAIASRAHDLGLAVTPLGELTETENVRLIDGESALEWNIAHLRDPFTGAIGSLMNKAATLPV